MSLEFEALSARIRLLEDIEAIKKLQHTYTGHGDVWDDRQNPEALAALFVEDGELALGVMGTHRGREAIAANLRAAGGYLHASLHIASTPGIEVEGDRATGEWYIFAPTTVKGSDEPMILAGKYFDKYVRTSSGWRFQRKELRMAMQPSAFTRFFDKP